MAIQANLFVVRWLLALLMIVAGIFHFAKPAGFVRVVPPYLPWPRMLVYVSGFFEILGGLGLLYPPVSRWAAWGLVALLIAVFPANIHMAIHRIPLGSRPLPDVLLWLRLPLQFALIAWAYRYTR